MAKPRTALEPVTTASLGELLRYFRERANLSQRELAQKVGYHYSYISRLEKNERALSESALRKLFIPALKLEHDPKATTRLLELATSINLSAAITDADLQPASSPARSAGLPVSLTPLLGREAESASLFNILLNEGTRLVTLIGAPGVGKTRLALHVAEQLASNFSDGVIFVDLMPVLETDQVLPTLAAALDTQENNLPAILSQRSQLIVIDNFEQVLESAPQLLPLLNAPKIKILTTSREALRLRGEQEFPLAPLPVPDEKTNPSALDFASVQLFLQRAQSAKPDFQLEGEDVSRAAEICRRLDGLPLAIELAAARIRSLSLTAMLKQFDRRFEWLTHGGRDLPVWRQTLWGAIEWSYTLLSGQERALFTRLSVFAGGWNLEAAEEICSDELLCTPSDILNLLIQLIDKSLITVDAQTGRYHFLETLREFAFENLKDGNDLEPIRQRHAVYYIKSYRLPNPTKTGRRSQ
ncbi:MAG: XRE family transcriptional regulator [Anaerolineales bacterium]|uniref:ATP-binding protein n=1 Tax=Candidatus Villigracilis proximus TaxID=3140683 RepID=UPI0031369B59|nr:XRE family transcriptional regulator [Anaerolineales bacterium]